MLRIVIAEDSVTQREILRRSLSGDPLFSVVGEARNGREAVAMVERHRPDVVLMDIHMPDMDGVEATRQIMNEMPVPIVIASASLKPSEVDLGLEALKAGAVSVIEKPQGAVLLHLDKIAPQLKSELLMAATVKFRRPPGGRVLATPPAPARSRSHISIYAMVASTGGPPVLVNILSRLPKPLPVPILLVQHIADSFVPGFARWMEGQTGHPTRLATSGQLLEPGIWMSPGGRHLTVTPQGRISLVPPRGREIHCPSGDALFSSLAKYVGSATMGIILTGMGSDGAAGLAALRQAGGRTIGQDEASSLIYGMPKAARDASAVELELPPGEIADLMSATMLSVPPPLSFS